MLPVSASDIIEFRPAAERVARAQAALAEAEGARPKNPVTIAAAKADVTAAEAAQAKRDPAYRLRVPTIRTKSASARDLVAEGIVTRTNADLVDAILASADEISPEDAAFVTAVKAEMKDAETVAPASWSRVVAIARSVPGASRIIADRIHHGNMSRLHTIRHHLVLDGQRSPLPESAVDALPSDDAAEIAAKIESLMFPSEVEVKNSDAP